MARAWVRSTSGVSFALVTCALALPGAARATAVTPAIQTWVPDNTVSSIAVAGTTAYIGGRFDYVGPDTGSAAVLSSSSGVPLTPYSQILGTVRVSIPDGTGGYYAGGSFAFAGGAAHANLVHIEANGTVDPKFVPKPNGAVGALALSGTTLYVGGAFKTMDGIGRPYAAAVNAATGGLKGWSPGVSDSLGPAQVNALAVAGSTVYVGGFFSKAGGQARNNIAAVDATTGKATAWNPGVGGGVYVLALDGSALYVGGLFSAVGGQSRTNLAAIDAVSGQVTNWAPAVTSASRPVVRLVADGSTIWAAANPIDFITADGFTTGTNVVALDASTGAETPSTPTVAGFVDAMALDGSTLYLGGGGMLVDGQVREGLAALDADTGALTAWNPTVGGAQWDNSFGRGGVGTVTTSGTTVFAGGSFNSVGGVDRPGLAAIDLTTGEATSWDPDVAPFPPRSGLPTEPPSVSAVAVDGSTLFVAGGFTALDGEPRNTLGAFDVTTGLPTAWNPDPNSDAGGIATDGPTIYVGGGFSEIGGQPRNLVAALDATSGQATMWNADANCCPAVMAVNASTSYLAGSFSEIGGQSRNGLAALDAGTGAATAWAPTVANSNGFRGTVNALAISGSNVYLGGEFTLIDRVSRRGIGAVDAVTGKVTPFTATTAYTPTGGAGEVSAIAPSSTALYVGGLFTTIRGSARNGLAALPPTGSSGTLSWNPDPNTRDVFSTVNQIVPDGSVVLIGGGFTALGNDAQEGFAELPAP